jgi:tetratricopeptide (TPR) repeat protein
VDILHKHAPDLPIATLSARLLRDGSWSALYAALPKAPLPPALEAWQALVRAQSAVYMGDTAQAERFARLWARSPAPGAVSTAPVYEDYRLEPVDFTPAMYQTMLEEHVRTLQARGNTDILLEIADGPGLRGLPAAPLAAIVAEAGFALRTEGKAAEARSAWEKALRLDSRQPMAHLGLALAEKAAGNAEASRRHFELGKGASLDRRLFVQAQMHLMDGDQAAARAVYTQLVRHDPDNQDALYHLFDFYREEKNYTAARNIRDRFALLAKNRPAGDQAAIFLAITEAGLGNHARAEALLRAALRRVPGHVWATRQLVVVLREQGRHGEAEDLLAATGVADPDPLGRLRRLAQQALAHGCPETAEDLARRYLESNPHSGYMHMLYITALQEQGKLEEVQDHAQRLLSGNEAFAGALRSLLRIVVLEEKELEASELTRAMAEHAPHDPLARLEDAVHDPRHPLALVESLAAKGPNAAYALWHFPGIARNSQDEYATLADIDHLLRKSAATHKTTPFSSLFAQEAPPKADDADAPAPIPTVLIFGAMEEARLREVDAMLVRREARAVLLVTEESFLPDGPDNSPRPEFLRRLALSGRWEFILTDTQRRRIVKDAAGRKVSFWDGPEWQGEAWESPDAMRARLLPVLRGIRQRALEAGFDLDAWMYPAGDHGQNKPEFTKAYREAYESAVDEVFDKTLVSTPLGYHVQDGPKKRIPVRLFYAAPKNEAIRAFGERHPTRQAALNEGMIAAWDRQMPRSLKTLRGAAPYGLSPVDMSFYQASSALNAGDTAQVARLSRDALALNPDAPRAQILRQRVEKRLRPDLFANYRTWQDDDKRRFTEIATGMEGHVSERLLLSVGASWLEWGRGSRNTAGQALGFGARWFTFDDHWLDASLRLVRPEEGNSAFLEGSFAWNGLLALDALRFNGAFTARYARESLESLESIEQDIYADHLSLSGDFRFLDRGLLIGSADLILRTDGNTTQRLMLRPGFLLCDEPIIELGYQLEIADSDRDPDAYYAPQGYQSHLATLRIEYALTPWLSLDGNVQYGRASTRDASDREVLRYGARAALTITDSLSLDMGYRKLKLPNYALDTATIGLRWEF